MDSYVFSFTPSQPARIQQCIHRHNNNHQLFLMQLNGDNDEEHRRTSRRNFFAKVMSVVATAPALLTSEQAFAADVVTNEPTKIELSVDTDYLIRCVLYSLDQYAQDMHNNMHMPYFLTSILFHLYTYQGTGIL